MSVHLGIIFLHNHLIIFDNDVFFLFSINYSILGQWKRIISHAQFTDRGAKDLPAG